MNMAMTLEQISLEVLGLPAKHRAILAEKILRSLDEDAEANTEELWKEEAERRWKEIQDGTAKCRPAEDVLRDVRASLTSLK